MITAYWNYRTGALVSSPGSSAYIYGRVCGNGNPPSEALRLHRADVATLRVRAFDPWDGDDVCLLPAGELVATLKPWDDHNSATPLAQISDDLWDKPATTDDNAQNDLPDNPGGWYVGQLDLGSTELDELLPAGTSDVYCHLQLRAALDDGTYLTSQWVPVIILSDVARSTDGAPAIPSQPSPSAALYYKGITSLTGGGATALDGIPTVGKSGMIAQFFENSQFQTWLLFTGTLAESASDGVVRPDDFDLSTNAQIWKRVQ